MASEKISQTVSKIIEGIRKGGDQAVFSYVNAYDGIDLSKSGLKVSAKEISDAQKRLPKELKGAIKASYNNVSAFHKKELSQIKKKWVLKRGGLKTGQIWTPIENVGIYVPGGLFSYPSTVIMTAIAAKIAGVKNIAIATPPKKINDALLFAARLCGIDAIYKVGGAVAIAAFALGTKTINKVDLIAGPGNVYVNEAKRALFGTVGIDALAGPSEVAIIADKKAPSDYIAADILAQAEHDPNAKAYFFCESAKKIEEVLKKVRAEKADISKQLEIKHCSLKEAVKCVNVIAPEHLEILVEKPVELIALVQNAGAIFAGYQTPTSSGDYWAGPSHTLPTGSSARFSSGLSVMTFLKRTSFIEMDGANKKAYREIAAFAQSEGLLWHKKSAEIRISKD